MAERVGKSARRSALTISCLATLCCVIGANLSWGADDPNVGTSSRTARDEAIRAIPFDKMPRENGAIVKNVVDATSVYRRMPQQTIDCEPDLYLQVLRNPELIVNMWTNMGITKMTMDKFGPGQYRMADGDGTKGIVQMLHADDTTHVVYSEGTYSGPMYARTIRGKCVLLVRSRYGQDNRGRMQITTTLDMFLTIENLGVELLAKTFSGTVAKASDHNFIETVTFVSKLSKTSENNPDGVIRMARKIPQIEPQVMEEFCTAIAEVEPKLEQARRSYLQRVAATEQAAATGRPATPRGLSPVTPQMKR